MFFNGITLVIGLLVTPLLLRWLGEERFGAFRVSLDWIGYLGLLELGLGAALPPLLARSLGQGNSDGIRNTLAAGLRAYFRITLLMLVAGLGLVAGIRFLVPVQPDQIVDLQRACAVALLGAL